MVLMQRIICLGICLALGACSTLHQNNSQNRSPTTQVVPAQPQPVIFPKKEETPAPEVKAVETAPNKHVQPSIPQAPTAEPVFTTRPKDVLTTIKESAQKAINEKQWIRGQYHLDHALRVAPKDAEVYYLYAQVYEGLGSKSQQMNMLKRAKFLAKPQSEIHRLASEALNNLNQ